MHSKLFSYCRDDVIFNAILIKPSLLFLHPQTQRHVNDLYEDLRDGHNLISLLEVLSGETLVSVTDCLALISMALSQLDS